MRTRIARLAILAFVVLITPLAARASEHSDDLKARRARMMQRLGPDAMLVLFSAPVRNYSLDVSYEYRQDSNLYYLTGMTEEETILVLMPGNTSRREILFVKDRDPVREHWQGRLLSREEATAQTGVSTVLSTNQFEPFVAAILGRRPFSPVEDGEASSFFGALEAGRAHVALALDPGGVNDPLNRPQDLARRIRDRYVGFQTIDATPILIDLRLIKTPYERKMLDRSLDISSEAQMAGMRAARPAPGSTKSKPRSKPCIAGAARPRRPTHRSSAAVRTPQSSITT